jgi:hypothetical protein
MFLPSDWLIGLAGLCVFVAFLLNIFHFDNSKPDMVDRPHSMRAAAHKESGRGIRV